MGENFKDTPSSTDFTSICQKIVCNILNDFAQIRQFMATCQKVVITNAQISPVYSVNGALEPRATFAPGRSSCSHGAQARPVSLLSGEHPRT